MVRDSSGRKVLAQSRTAGLSAIQLYLGSSNRSIREIEAGAAYMDTQEREEERKVQYLVCAFMPNNCICK